MNISSSVKFSRSLKVLVVEDNNVDLRVLEAMLAESEGSASLLKSARTLQEALEHLRKFSFDVVILDLNLPDTKGMSSTNQITEKYPDLAIVINTGAYEEASQV